MRIAYLIGLLAGTIIRAHHTAERARAAAEERTPIFDQLARERAADDQALIDAVNADPWLAWLDGFSQPGVAEFAADLAEVTSVDDLLYICGGQE